MHWRMGGELLGESTWAYCSLAATCDAVGRDSQGRAELFYPQRSRGEEEREEVKYRQTSQNRTRSSRGGGAARATH